jgi:hypothetical protein
MITKLPTIRYKNRTFTFDYRLSELRTIRGKHGLLSMSLCQTEKDMLDYAIKHKNKNLIKELMKEIFRY